MFPGGDVPFAIESFGFPFKYSTHYGGGIQDTFTTNYTYLAYDVIFWLVVVGLIIWVVFKVLKKNS